MVCRAHGVRLIYDSKVKLKLGLDFPDLDDHEWDAKAIEFPGGRQAIIARKQPHSGREVWSIIHELGHLLLGHEGAVFHLDTFELVEAEQWHEEEANRFARHLLLPTDEMVEFRRQGLNPKQISERKGVSIAAINIRLRTMRREGALDGWSSEAG